MTEDKLLYLGIDVLVLLLVQLQLMATLSRSIFMIMDLNSVALSGVKAGSPRATEQQSCTQGKKNLEAAPRIIFAIFHSFWPFFQRFLPFLSTEWEPPHSILAYSRPVLLSRKCPKVAFPVWV